MRSGHSHVSVRRPRARQLDGRSGMRTAAFDRSPPDARHDIEMQGRTTNSSTCSAMMIRPSAAALGRIGRRESIQPLLQVVATPGTDRMFEHALVFALIEIGDRDATLDGLHHLSPRVRRAALVALDQMDDGKLTRQSLAGLLPTDDPELQDAIVDVVSRHTEWAGLVIGLLRNWLLDQTPNPARGWRRRDAAIQSLMAEALALAETPVDREPSSLT